MLNLPFAFLPYNIEYKHIKSIHCILPEIMKLIRRLTNIQNYHGR